MIIELGNEAALRSIDGRPAVTTIHIPEADETGLGGYSHEPGGITVQEFRDHRAKALEYASADRYPIYQCGDHEALLSIVNAWPQHSTKPPTWIEVTPRHDGHDPKESAKVAADIEAFLHEYYGTDGAQKPLNVEETHWTKFGPPGVLPAPPDITALFTDVGRVLQANNYGGGQVGATGTGTAASSTTFTSASTWTTNQWAGYKIVVSNSSGAMVWGNIKSNTNAGSASVATVDRWYNFATPGGAAGTTPASGYFWAILDGGSTSAWFVGMTTTNITPAHGDTSMSGEYTTAGGGYIRKIAPFSLTSGTSPGSFTLTPVYTGNGTDTYPQTFYAIGVFNSMVSGDTVSTMMFETSLNASATVAASGDVVTVTETVTES